MPRGFRGGGAEHFFKSMKLRKVFSQTAAFISLLMVATRLPLYGDIATSQSLLGSGDPGLKIIYKSQDQYVIFRDEPWTVGTTLYTGYDRRHIVVLLDRGYGLKGKIQVWGDDPQQLYPFDDQTVFTCELAGLDSTWKSPVWPNVTQVFTEKSGDILVANDVYGMARREYKLTDNQMFLGRLGTNIFYWERSDPRKVFFRTIAQKAATNYFELSAGVKDVMGVTKALKKDVGIMVYGKSPTFFHYAPYCSYFIEESFKSAKIAVE
jgi:hypothetical protein